MRVVLLLQDSVLQVSLHLDSGSRRFYTTCTCIYVTKEDFRIFLTARRRNDGRTTTIMTSFLGDWTVSRFVFLLFVVLRIHSLEGRQGRRLEILEQTLEYHPIAQDVPMVDNISGPKFAREIQNKTVSIGHDAVLECIVDNLQKYKVAWVRIDTQTILSIHQDVITQNPRISLSYNDHRTWSLQIKNTQESDRGWYMCQVNTNPMRYKQGYLQVHVPPSIIDKDTSTDMVVRESTNVTLTCKAKGYPAPYVLWRRADNKIINYNGKSAIAVDGEVLHFVKIKRLHMGKYLCIASNGVKSPVSKSVTLNVHFPPMLSIPNQWESASIGQDVILECHIEAFPSSINYWITENGNMIVPGEKYETIFIDKEYTTIMILKIRNVGPKDFGLYKCVAQNSLGSTDGVIKLDELPALSTTSTTQAPYYVTSLTKKNGRNGKKNFRQRPSDYEIEEWRNSDYENEFESASMIPPGDLPVDALNLGVAREPRLLLHLLLPSLLPLLLAAVRR